MLVPTTILAQQHYGTFAERLADYPFTLEHVSRFRSAAEQKEAIKGFAWGRVDILIGTHRVLSRDVRAKDLGLLIVDEEQRFGVKQKELLRQLKLRVDVISMSATPIPRTLQMSLAGLRDISVIETPPEGPASDQDIRGRVRGGAGAGARSSASTSAAGRPSSCTTASSRSSRRPNGCARCVPGVRFAVAHGQMAEGELEAVMLDYLRGGADVLVCTSIIESGIDIPHANTLIVEHADAFGLAQLYQIRGRVGRSRERAYAYLLYDSAAALTRGGRAAAVGAVGLHRARRGLSRSRCATSRSAAPATCSETSSPGTSRRSASSCTCRCSTRPCARPSARRRAAGEGDDAASSPEPVRLDVNVDAYVPADYVPTSRPRSTSTGGSPGALEVADVEQLREELEDRFGPVPEPLENLLALQRARIKFGQAGARTVSFRGDRLAVVPIELDSRRAKRLREELPEALYESGRAQMSMRVANERAGAFPVGRAGGRRAACGDARGRLSARAHGERLKIDV